MNLQADLGLNFNTDGACPRIESLDDTEVSEAWQEELNRRAKDIDNGNTELIEGDEVWQRVNKRFGTDF